MELSGAQALLKALEMEGTEVIFGYPGGANLYIYDALYDSNIRHVLARHEQGAVHAAEGYARASGKVGVCLVTSGPGATNLVTGLCDCMMDSTPVVAITAQVPRPLIGRDAFQEADVTGITMPVTKHNFLVTDPNDLPRIVKEAFYLARSGRPGPVLIDIPKDITNTKVQWYWPESVSMRGYRPHGPAAAAQVEQAATAIRAASHPVILCGGGVVLSDGASTVFRTLAEQLGAPVIHTLMGMGGFPMDHPLAFGLLGMHGTYAANKAVASSDLLVAVGVRFDDRVTGMTARFAPKATLVHIDVDPAEMSKNLTSHIPVIGDAQHVLTQLTEALADFRPDYSEWVGQVREWQAQHPLWGMRVGEELPSDPTGPIKPQQVTQAVQAAWGPEAVLVTDVGQHQMWAAHYCTRTEPRTWLTSGGLGTMGFGLPAAIGAAVARPDREVVMVSGDGSIQMCIQELGTILQDQLPVKVVVLNNGYLGMVRQWQQIFYKGRYSFVDIRSGTPDFVKLAEAYGIKGIRVTCLGELEPAMAEARATRGPVFVEVVVESEENVYPLVPPGGANTDAIMKAGD